MQAVFACPRVCERIPILRAPGEGVDGLRHPLYFIRFFLDFTEFRLLCPSFRPIAPDRGISGGSMVKMHDDRHVGMRALHVVRASRCQSECRCEEGILGGCGWRFQSQGESRVSTAGPGASNFGYWGPGRLPWGMRLAHNSNAQRGSWRRRGVCQNFCIG